MATIHDKLTAVANGIRTISGTTSTMGLDAMATHISNANTNVSSEANLITQISTALDGKAAGVNLNFDIKTYATEDELLVDKPSENTIGIISNIEINGYCFSADAPKGITEGKVWIVTGTRGASELYLLDNETIAVYPLFAKQYVNGAWVDIEAKSYQNGEWVEWWTGELFNNGEQHSDITGGWVSREHFGMSVSFGSNIEFTTKGDTGRDASVFTNNKLDVTNFSYIVFTVNVTDIDYYLHVGITEDNTSYAPSFVAKTTTESNGTQQLKVNVSDVHGLYFVAAHSDASNASISKIVMVR